MERKRDLPIASGSECETLRSNLIAKGTIIPSRPGDDDAQTRLLREQERAELIEAGVIEPGLCQLPPPILPRPRAGEEGEYKPVPISGERDYLRRRQVYFRMVQEILQSRQELRLILGQKGSNDPEWVF